MKIFDKNFKVNFVDKNNVFVGYDTDQSCCEYADWFIASKVRKEVPNKLIQDIDLSDYIFNTSFFKEFEYVLDAGGIAVFKLVAENKPDKYLHLFNSHNGYYGHGFEMTINDTDLYSGTL